MKKILILLAAAMLVVACGGNSGKKQETVEQKAAKFATEMCEAEAAGDYDKIEKLQGDLIDWVSNLSETDSEKAEAAFMKALDEWAQGKSGEYADEEYADEEYADEEYADEEYCDEEVEEEEWDEEGEW